MTILSRIFGTVHRLIHRLEKQLGVVVVFNGSTFRIVSAREYETRQRIRLLQERGILKKIWRVSSATPPIYSWYGTLGGVARHDITVGGASPNDEVQALTALAAEAMERYIWCTQQDYFVHPLSATLSEVGARGAYIAPDRFVSFSENQRAADASRVLAPDDTFLWVQGESLITHTKVYLPAQIVSPLISLKPREDGEPMIRQITTNGLATWPTQAGARLAGILELIEREAYMVMWFNQLTPPKAKLDPVRTSSPTLDALITQCESHTLRVHALMMPTDAPTYAICVVLEDTSGTLPRFSFGLKAHRSLATAIEKAVVEALRGRSGTQHRLHTQEWNTDTPVDMIGHRDRLLYWAVPAHADKLTFLIQGDEKEYTGSAWDSDTDEDHLDRLLEWCREKDFECIAVSLGTSKANITPWHIEMMVLPDLHPVHLAEKYRHLNTTRLHEVPKLLRYTPRETPFIDAPHPFS